MFGCALLIRSDLYHALDGLDERFFLHEEDIDLCYRATLAGWGVSQITGIVSTHHGGGSSSLPDDLPIAAQARTRMRKLLDDGHGIPSYPDNPQGFFENADFVRLHEICLRRRHRFSAGWKATPRSSVTFSSSETELAQALIRARVVKYANWGWKDPRTTLFLEQWKHLAPQARIVVVWRPCDQVVYSLLRRWWKSRTRRHDLDPFWAIRLWQAHNRLACEFAERHPNDVLVIPITQVIAQDHAVLALLNSQFDADLRFTRLDELYAPESFNAEPPPAGLSGLCSAMGCRRHERRLAALAPTLLTS